MNYSFDKNDLENQLDEIYHLIDAAIRNIYDSDKLNIPESGGAVALMRVAREKVSFVQEEVTNNFTPGNVAA